MFYKETLELLRTHPIFVPLRLFVSSCSRHEPHALPERRRVVDPAAADRPPHACGCCGWTRAGSRSARPDRRACRARSCRPRRRASSRARKRSSPPAAPASASSPLRHTARSRGARCGPESLRRCRRRSARRRRSSALTMRSPRSSRARAAAAIDARGAGVREHAVERRRNLRDARLERRDRRPGRVAEQLVPRLRRIEDGLAIAEKRNRLLHLVRAGLAANRRGARFDPCRRPRPARSSCRLARGR